MRVFSLPLLYKMSITQPSIEECYRVLKKANSNIVWEILRQSEKFYQMDHYPKGDVYDPETHSQYYYHAHDPSVGTRQQEHGHFHIFLRRKGMPNAIQPLDIPKEWEDTNNSDDLSHLIAISMNKEGYPIRLFTVNRWVTGEKWYAAYCGQTEKRKKPDCH